MKACSDARAQVETKKGQYRAQKKQMAVTNPEEYDFMTPGLPSSR